ncbi:KEOPS complex subunit Cgi121 [Natronoarchaeum mannanilyticum]|uniref:KEOPS complex subunit Cgi121 n=1 Tax=Natronoarchaeum mannanilyticum TaxID=926360 RepID=A0AAV3T7X5_9EURY
MHILEGRATIEDVDAAIAELAAIGDEHGCTVQAFDARYLIGREHLERAIELADRAIERGENVARDRGVEILLYAAGRRQIDDALAMGVKAGEQDVAVLIDSLDAEDGEAEDASTEAREADAAAAVREALDLDERSTLGVEHADAALVRDFFDVSEAELAATDAELADVVLERVALLDVEK